MYDELVKMLRVCGDSNNSCGDCPIRENDGCCPHGEWEFAAEKYMLQAADAIEELICEVATEHNERLDAEERQRWIPVTERLPDTDTNVLIRSGSFVSVWSLREGDVYWEDDYGFFHDMCEVTHWMPLPQPPKEE